MFGKFNPDFEMQEISRINFKYLHSDEFKIIKQEEEKYVLEKWQYLKQFLKSKEVEECIEKAERQLKKELELETKKFTMQIMLRKLSNRKEITIQQTEKRDSNDTRNIEKETWKRSVNGLENIWKLIKKKR